MNSLPEDQSNNNKVLQTIKNSSWIIGGKIITFLVSFGLMTALAYFLDKKSIGTYNYIISIITIASITTFSGASTSLISAVARGKEGSTQFLARKRLLFGLLGTGIIFLIGLYYLYKDNTLLGYIFLASALFIPLTDTLNEIAIAYWQGKKEFKKSTLLAVLYQVLFTTPSIILLFFTKNIFIITISFLSFQALSGFLLYTTIHPQNKERDIETETFSLHITFINGLRILSMTIDKIIVWQLLGPIPLAIYMFASTPINKLEQLIPIEQLTLPSLSLTEDSPKARKTIIKKSLLLFICLIPILILGILISPLLYKIFFPNFTESVPLFQLLLIGTALSCSLLPKTALIAWKKRSTLYAIEITSLVGKSIFMLLFGVTYGLTGIIYGLLIARVCESILTYILFTTARR